MESNEGFGFYVGYSTTNIFFYDESNPILPPGHALPRARLGYFKWRHSTGQLRYPILPANVLSRVTIHASCKGLIACRCDDTSMYHVGNPFITDAARYYFIPRYYDLPVTPTFHYPAETHVVLAVVPSTAFLVFCARQRDTVYTFETFNSASNRWESNKSRVDLRFDARVVPNSGASCGRSAYWILCNSTRAPTHVVRFTFRDDHQPPSSSEASFLKLPPGLRGQERMRLGRAMGGLCLLVVNEDTSTVEIFTLNAHAANGGSILQRFELFNVVVLADGAAPNRDGWVASWRQEDRTIVCREMPRPMRFESFKVELLLWVRGRVLLLENSAIDPHNYRLTVFPHNMHSSITDGRPYVFKDSLPTDFLGVAAIRMRV